mmetsp:Transcript_118030/g.376322  ORF Transcript_118030/g.376322 Transcript_118030/m.376322 type:complete len:395 (+) Transcript_118030:455-1639(+)
MSSDEPVDTRSHQIVHGPAKDCLQDAHVTITVEEHLLVRHFLQPRMSWFSLHQRRLCGLHGIRHSGPDVGADVDEQDVLRGQGLGHAEELTEGRGHLGDLRAERVHDGLLQVFAREPTLLDAHECRGEVIVQKDDVRCILRHLGAADAHGDAHLGLLHGRRVVDAITGHRHDVSDATVAQRLESLDDDLLVQRRDPCEHTRLHHGAIPERADLVAEPLGKIAVFRHHGLELGAFDDCEILALLQILLRGQDVEAMRDGPGGAGVVARHHDHFDASGLRLLHRLRHSGPGRIFDAEETKELKAREAEAAIRLAGAVEFAIGRHLVGTDAPLRHAEHASALLHEHLQRLVGVPQRLHVEGATGQNALGRAFDDAQVGVGAVFQLVRCMNGDHPLVL